jgi:hypothetical protein
VEFCHRCGPKPIGIKGEAKIEIGKWKVEIAMKGGRESWRLIFSMSFFLNGLEVALLIWVGD